METYILIKKTNLRIMELWDYGIMELWDYGIMELWVIFYTSHLFSFTDTDWTCSQCVTSMRSAARTTLSTPLPP